MGFFIGSIVVSPISDKFGRKRPLFICGFFCWLFSFVSAFAPTFWFFALCRAIVGFMVGAYHIAVFVLATEFSGIRHRGIAGALVWLGIPLATIVLSGCAYAIRNWRLLTIVTGAPGILLVAGYFFTPESVRWLLKKGRVSEAREVLRKVARLNGKDMPDEALLLPNDEKVERLGDLRDLFISVKMTHKTLASWLMWFAVSFIYWGISFTAPFLGGNIYINVLISAVAGLPGYPVSAVLTARFSRKKILVASFILSSVGAIGALLLSAKDDDKGYFAGKIFMSMFLAKSSAVVAFTLVYVFTAEMFPTTIRIVAMGTSTASARLSAFASAYAPLLFSYSRYLPFGIMGGLALSAAVVCVTLPETHNQPTMENLLQRGTLEHGEGDETQATVL